MLKQTLNTALILTFLLLFTGCGSSPAQPATAQSTQAITTSQATQNTPPPVVTQKVPPANVSTNTSSPAKVTGEGPNGEGIKGHTDKKGVMIYHLPGDPYYSRTTHISGWFFTEKDAQAAGYRHILK